MEEVPHDVWGKGVAQRRRANNILEGDHGRLKRILGPKGAFKTLFTI